MVSDSELLLPDRRALPKPLKKSTRLESALVRLARNHVTRE